MEYSSESVEKNKTPRLKRDKHGICAFPTVDKNQLFGNVESEHTSRLKRRMVSRINSHILVRPYKLAHISALIYIQLNMILKIQTFYCYELI